MDNGLIDSFSTKAPPTFDELIEVRSAISTLLPPATHVLLVTSNKSLISFVSSSFSISSIISYLLALDRVDTALYHPFLSLSDPANFLTWCTGNTISFSKSKTSTAPDLEESLFPRTIHILSFLKSVAAPVFGDL